MERMGFIHVALDMGQWQALVNNAIYLQVAKTFWTFLSS
jgi:hypothetical protein